MMELYRFYAEYAKALGASTETRHRLNNVIRYRKPKKYMFQSTCDTIIRAHRAKPDKLILLDPNVVRLRRRTGTWIRIDLRKFQKANANDNGGP